MRQPRSGEILGRVDRYYFAKRKTRGPSPGFHQGDGVGESRVLAAEVGAVPVWPVSPTV